MSREQSSTGKSEHRRCDISVADNPKTNSSSVGAKYVAPTGLGNLMGLDFFFDFRNRAHGRKVAKERISGKVRANV
jgi:hypothetical protein